MDRQEYCPSYLYKVWSSVFHFICWYCFPQEKLVWTLKIRFRYLSSGAGGLHLFATAWAEVKEAYICPLQLELRWKKLTSVRYNFAREVSLNTTEGNCASFEAVRRVASFSFLRRLWGRLSSDYPPEPASPGRSFSCRRPGREYTTFPPTGQTDHRT